MTPGLPSTRIPMPLLRALFAVLALVGQLAVGSLVLPDRLDAASVARINATMVLCKSSSVDRVGAGHVAPAHRHHPVQHARAPEQSLELPAAILLPAVELPPPPLPVRRDMATLPPSRAPPCTAAWAWRARAPPILA